ncbi:Isocitrate lyase [Blumeria graminis f. sp. tritici 96224]|uniref:Bgt-4837 n=1 Tax=Blumeria graminis f. sp. tritici 96224 TaxID=1268274 RepID=A0A061HL13_BLUGR|nr:Isocitrate lyase [Blumeria graminis f. sp. tritici 96224]
MIPRVRVALRRGRLPEELWASRYFVIGTVREQEKATIGYKVVVNVRLVEQLHTHHMLTRFGWKANYLISRKLNNLQREYMLSFPSRNWPTIFRPRLIGPKRCLA